VFVASFIVGHGTLESIGAGLVAILVLAGLAGTSDQGHIVAPRVEDPLLSLAAAAVAAAEVRLLKAPPVFSAALVGALGGMLVRLVAGARDHHGGPIYVGAFVGGTAAAVLPSFAWVLFAGLLAGAFWSVSREAWVGIGGKMGTLALGGVLISYGVAATLGSGGSPGVPLDAGGVAGAVLVIAALAAPATGALAFSAGWGPVLGSAVPTALFALLLLLAPGLAGGHAGALTVAWFGASFVGMTAPARLPGYVVLLPVGGLLYGALLLEFGTTLSGMGGTAGATALIAVFAVRGAVALVRGLRAGAPASAGA
jgi:hypothetical protein